MSIIISNAVNYNSMFSGTCSCCFVCVYALGFLYFLAIYILLSGSLSHILNSVLNMMVGK